MPKKKKTEEVVLREPKVVDSPLEEIVADRFSRYSKYIIQERALPDARDGLKPVQRRILWAMKEDGNTYSRPYRKSAKTVGNVIGNYHPHGDISVYDTIVRLSQDWKSELPLIDMQGNNGSIDDDPPAAMRYTEARLSRIAEYLMEDIDRDTVDWAPNFSDEKYEPTVLPARYPNLLINGITGIAAGYATSIPPHNLNEVIDATIYRLDHPKCTTKDLMEFVKGPDFPTGGIVMGKEGIEQALETGRGKVVVRARAEIEEKKTMNQIVIHEIPYDVVKVSLVKRIDELRLSGKVSGMLDVRDESDRKGLRIVIDLKKEANPQAILNYLYKNTDLQVNCHYNVIAIVNRTPRQLGLKEMLDAFIDHREEVVIKRTRYDLKRAKERMHILEGLIRALSILDEIIALIRSSSGKADSKDRLMKTYDFSAEQAEAIVTMQLYRLSNTDVKALAGEAEDLAKEISSLEKILESPKARKNLMKKELREMSKEFVLPRRSQIVDTVEKIVINETDMIADETVVSVVSRHGYFKRVPLRSYASSDQTSPALKEGDTLEFCDQTSTLDSLLFFTDQGRYGLFPVYQTEEKKWKDPGVHYSSQFKIDSSERIVAVFALRQPVVQSDLLLFTRKGMTSRVRIEDLSLPAKGRPGALMNLSKGDALIDVVASTDDEDEIVLVTERGYGLKVETGQISATKGRRKGLLGLRLQNEDALLSASLVDGSDLLLENTDGQFKRIAMEEVPAPNRPAVGSMMFKGAASRRIRIEDARAAAANEEVRFEDLSQPALKVSSLNRMLPSATWAKTGSLDQAMPFARRSRWLRSGSRSRSEPESEYLEVSLFDDSSQNNE